MAEQYETYLKNLLEPLALYSFAEGAVSTCALHALGSGLDALAERLACVEREAAVATAEDQGLSRREALFARRPAAPTTALRRRAIASLFQISGDSLTPEDIGRTISGCGIRAKAREMETAGKIQVYFPDVAGEPEGAEQIEKIIRDIIPCHLEVEFYFRYLTWTECEKAQMTWAGVEAQEHTWKTFQAAVPPEE
ncbi:MAG: hypothetical protein LKJ80_02035 [Oscillibacter sp.]|jgi:hypothetical protein|nr:hypothetical protein [Oscillibacter sp.]